MRKLRWIVYAPAALIAFFASPAVAQEFITWTCQAETSWQMQQPLTDYESGLYPNWFDCEAWRDGTPAEGWQWSYGAGVATTTSSSSTVAATSTVPQTTTSTLPATTTTATTELPTTTEGTTTTTSLPTPTTLPIPQTSPSPQATEPATTTTASTTTLAASPTTVAALPTSSTPVAPESSQAPTTPPPTFVSPGTSLWLAPSQTPTPGTQLGTPPPGASEQEKEAFEEQVNIFDGTHDEYVPAGSTITVAQRRTIVAASTILMTLPTPVASRRRT